MKNTNVENFDFVAKMLCGEELTEEDLKQKEIFEQEYDEAHESK